MARSLLSRVSTRTDGDRGDDSDKSDSGSTRGKSPLRKTRSVQDESQPSSPLATAGPAVTSAPLTQVPQGDGGQVSQSAAKGASIESTVRMFRLYEALRSGDTAAITKGIKESSVNKAETDRRESTSSFASQTSTSGSLDGTTVLHLAIQCAELPVIEFVLSTALPTMDINSRDRDGNTSLHVASMLSRAPVVRLLLTQKGLNDSLPNYQGKTPLDLARNPEIFEQLQLHRSMYIDANVKKLQSLIAAGSYDRLEKLLVDPHVQSVIDVNGVELATDPATTESGGTLLHEAARKKDIKVIQMLLLNGADPFRRDRRGKLPQDVTKDDRTRAILKKSPAAAVAQRGIQEKTILGSNTSQVTLGAPPGENILGNKEGREFKGYLKKWTNYTSGYKLRWFVLEDGVLSYYKHQDDAGSACRGAINMRIAKLHMNVEDRLKFEIHGKSSVKYHLKANHQVEAKRWYWALNNAIQWAKDEAKTEAKNQARDTETLRQAKLGQADKLQARGGDNASTSTGRTLLPGSAVGFASNGFKGSQNEDDDAATSMYEPSLTGNEMSRVGSNVDTTIMEGDVDNGEDYNDEASSVEAQPTNKDAFMIAAQSARVQLDLLAQISAALQAETTRNPTMTISEPTVTQALLSYEGAVGNLKGLIGDLGRITRDRESYWMYRLEQEINVRRIWEESMARVAKEQEDLENKYGESEEKRKRTKRALRDALEGTYSEGGARSRQISIVTPPPRAAEEKRFLAIPERDAFQRRKSTIAEFTNISDSESDDNDEFFDAVDAGEVEVVEDLPLTSPKPDTPQRMSVSGDKRDIRVVKESRIQVSGKGYEDGVRKRLAMDADNRPKISLWSILKSMIGKDMTKMTLPVSFNEPTSLLQRVAEDMEYTDLLDTAAERDESAERMVYVAAFAASEYASTIGRVAKPFNPLLGETYEYVRSDKGYRFLIEQVSHHPPIGAAWAESSNWDYYGESAVKSKFYGKSFDINPLGTWFLRLRPANSPPGTEELYTWKKVTSSVVGIVTGSPTVDNYGPMEVRNHGTGDVCILDFKQRGWKASSAYQVTGKVLNKAGTTVWSLGGRWNDKIYARPAASFDDAAESGAQAFLVWEAHARPTGIPFNLTPFVVTLNAIPEALRACLPPTDTRLRPDQRAMEDGEYDFAASEKNRLEEKQRAVRRAREQRGEEFKPKWFIRAKCKITGEEYWRALGAQDGRGKEVDYWGARHEGQWERCEDIF